MPPIFMNFRMRPQRKQWFLQKNGTKLRDGLNCDGFNIVQNNGEIAGQTVFHFHMHLIPRYEGDQVGLTWKPGELTDEMKEEILNKVKA